MKNIAYIFLFFSTFLHAHVIEVGTNKPVKSIKKALSLAKDGDTVLVHKGIYKEGNIIIDKKIVVETWLSPILDFFKQF